VATETTHPQATQPPQTPQEPLLAPSPGFRAPTPPRAADQPLRTLPADTPTIHDQPRAEEPEPDGPDLSTSKVTPSQVSTGELEALLGLVTTAVRIPTMLVNDRRGPGTALWLLEPEDEATICGPLAAILARHAPMGDGDSSDIIDGMIAGVGVGGFVLKNLQRERQLRARYGAMSVEQEPPGYAGPPDAA
jgi:hypothetical protein